MYWRQQINPSQGKRKARRQSGHLRRLYKQLKKEEKIKGERNRYTLLNADFQKIARRDNSKERQKALIQ